MIAGTPSGAGYCALLTPGRHHARGDANYPSAARNTSMVGGAWGWPSEPSRRPDVREHRPAPELLRGTGSGEFRRRCPSHPTEPPALVRERSLGRDMTPSQSVASVARQVLAGLVSVYGVLSALISQLHLPPAVSAVLESVRPRCCSRSSTTSVTPLTGNAVTTTTTTTATPPPVVTPPSTTPNPVTAT